MNPRDLRATILSSVPPISIPLHARQELCSFPSKKKNSAVVFVAARYVFVDGNMRTKEACLEKAETNRISFTNIYRHVISSKRVRLDIDS